VVVLEPTVEILFNYLRNVVYNPSDAVLEVDKLPKDFQEFGTGLKYFAECVMETKGLAQALSIGDLSVLLPARGNELAAPLKSLHASLRHLTWQAQQIAQGDYNQRIDFMGEFSYSFNKMVQQLAERRQKLEDKIEQIQKKKESLEQSNHLLTTLMHHVPQQIIVIERDTHEILLMNNIAVNEVNSDVNYLENMIKMISSHKDLDNGREVDITYVVGETERYFMVKTYFLEWNNSNAEILVISDVSATKCQIKTLEVHAYRDSLTQLYNRTFGMLTLDSWLFDEKKFVLIFADLDKLKFVNDEFGHNEGDEYIKNAARHLKTFSSDAVVCRIGGDEYMLLASDISYHDANERMKKISYNLQNDEYQKNKEYSYSISYGIVEVKETLLASDILSIADERMYECKKMRRKNRQD